MYSSRVFNSSIILSLHKLLRIEFIGPSLSFINFRIMPLLLDEITQFGLVPVHVNSLCSQHP